jgi:hypothetical protein
MGLQFAAPVTAAVTILSGQMIYLTAANTWSLATDTLISNGAAPAEPYIALQDSVDTDVLSSGLLLGLSCAGQYVFETGYYVRTDGAFNAPGLPLVVSNAVPGSLTLATAQGGVAWDANQTIVGVTAFTGEEQVGPSTNAAGVFIPAINTEALPLGGPTYMLPFTAKWMPKRSVAT